MAAGGSLIITELLRDGAVVPGGAGGLWDVLPNLTRDDTADELLAHGKDTIQASLPCSRAAADLYDVWLREDGSTVAMAARSGLGMKAQALAVAACLPALRHLVDLVIEASPEEEVVRVHAPWVVAAWTVVADLEPLRDGAMCQFPRDSVGAPVLSSDFEASITVPKATGPGPALGSLVHLRPESLHRRTVHRDVCSTED